jgi:hypothetical protein
MALDMPKITCPASTVVNPKYHYSSTVESCLLTDRRTMELILNGISKMKIEYLQFTFQSICTYTYIHRLSFSLSHIDKLDRNMNDDDAGESRYRTDIVHPCFALVFCAKEEKARRNEDRRSIFHCEKCWRIGNKAFN